MLEKFKVCYHGTTTKQQLNMMQSQGIQLKYSAKATDFGQGFYLTTNYAQAKSLAYRKAMKERAEYLFANQTIDQSLVDTMIQPVVLTYRINTVGLKQLKGKEFATSDEHWANFILNNRISPLSYTEMEYDYAVGPVADGSVFKIMMDYQDNHIDKAEFHQQILPKGKMKSYNQLSVNSLKAVQYLQYKGSELV